MTENDEACLNTLWRRRWQAEASHARVVARWEAATEARHEAYEVMEEAKEAYKKIKLSSAILMREVNEPDPPGRVNQCDQSDCRHATGNL